jgi:hypothetical protein
MKFKETEVAAPVVSWLSQQGWEVYQEVSVRGGRRADIVAVKDGLLWIVEAKTTLNLEVMGQAAEWKGWCHLISFAVPARSGAFRYAMRRGVLTNRARKVVRAMNEVYGVGCMVVLMGGALMNPADRVHVDYRPVEAENPRMADYVRGSLCEEQKTFAQAGSAGTYWTPYKGTCERLRRYVAAHPGCSVSEAVANIETHYASKASAKVCLLDRAKEGQVPGVRADEVQRGRRTLFFLWPDPATVDEALVRASRGCQ